MVFFREKEFKALNTDLNQGNHAAVINRMSKWQLSYMALFQQDFPQQKDKLKHPDFTTFWQQQRESMPLYGHSGFRFQAQKDIDDVDVVMGYVFYLLALKSKFDNQMESYTKYLRQALTHSSFHAAQKTLHDLVTSSIDKNEDYCKRLVDTLQQWEDLTNQHGSPGYLLLANGYFWLATHAKLIENGQDMRQGAFACMWRYLNLALFAEERSKASIHNAYFGLGLAQSNPFNIATLDNMLAECRRFAGDALPLPTQKLIKTQTLCYYNKLQEGADSSAVKSITN